MNLKSEMDQWCELNQISDTDRAWLSGVMTLLACMVFTVASSFAGESRFDIDERINSEIGGVIFPHSDQCRRVYTGGKNYLVCLVRGELEAYQMRDLSGIGNTTTNQGKVINE